MLSLLDQASELTLAPVQELSLNCSEFCKEMGRTFMQLFRKVMIKMINDKVSGITGNLTA